MRNIVMGDIQIIVPGDFLKLDFNNLDSKGQVALCLVDNGVFTALAVLDSSDEFKYFKEKDAKDNRRKFYFFCKKELAEKEVRGMFDE